VETGVVLFSADVLADLAALRTKGVNVDARRYKFHHLDRRPLERLADRWLQRPPEDP
jgi:biotin operon repressor